VKLSVVNPDKEAIELLTRTLLVDGELQVAKSSFLRQFRQDDISAFCVYNGFYCLPTVELIDFLNAIIIAASPSRNAIEIGSGNGVVGRALGIEATDSMLQADPQMAALYAAIKQPVVTYGKNVVKVNANSAVKRYNPEVVIGCWVTHKFVESEEWRGGNMFGIDEQAILDHPSVKAYLVVGHEDTHKNKPILKHRHLALRPNEGMLFSRSVNPEGNVIYAWVKEGSQVESLLLPLSASDN